MSRRQYHNHDNYKNRTSKVPAVEVSDCVRFPETMRTFSRLEDDVFCHNQHVRCLWPRYTHTDHTSHERMFAVGMTNQKQVCASESLWFVRAAPQKTIAACGDMSNAFESRHVPSLSRLLAVRSPLHSAYLLRICMTHQHTRKCHLRLLTMSAACLLLIPCDYVLFVPCHPRTYTNDNG